MTRRSVISSAVLLVVGVALMALLFSVQLTRWLHVVRAHPPIYSALIAYCANVPISLCDWAPLCQGLYHEAGQLVDDEIRRYCSWKRSPYPTMRIPTLYDDETCMYAYVCDRVQLPSPGMPWVE